MWWQQETRLSAVSTQWSIEMACSCTPETYIMLSTNFTSINLNLKKNKKKKEKLCRFIHVNVSIRLVWYVVSTTVYIWKLSIINWLIIFSSIFVNQGNIRKGPYPRWAHVLHTMSMVIHIRSLDEISLPSSPLCLMSSPSPVFNSDSMVHSSPTENNSVFFQIQCFCDTGWVGIKMKELLKIWWMDTGVAARRAIKVKAKVHIPSPCSAFLLLHTARLSDLFPFPFSYSFM